jgi:hypothetical protein
MIRGRHHEIRGLKWSCSKLSKLLPYSSGMGPRVRIRDRVYDRSGLMVRPEASGAPGRGHELRRIRNRPSPSRTTCNDAAT